MRRPAVLSLIVAAILVCACSPRQMGIRRMGEALGATTNAYSKDNDPEFVRLAAPSTLKMVEMLLEDDPSNESLLTAACSGFTQYAYGFLQTDAESSGNPDGEEAKELRMRAQNMYDRARDYCMRGLDVHHRGIRASVNTDASSALGGMTKADVPLLYWTGVALAGSVSMAENQLVRVGDLAVARGLLSRALALDESWDAGAIHEAFIILDGLPRLLGGSPARAAEHFKRAVELSGGQSASAYVSMATAVALREKNRAEFERLLRAALAIDINREPRLRLANAIAQKRARILLARAGHLF